MSFSYRCIPLALLVVASVASCGSDSSSSTPAASADATSGSTVASVSTSAPDTTEAPAATDDPAVASCGLTLVAASMRSYCGITGTSDGSTFTFDHPDSPTSRAPGAPVTNTAGQELRFGALKINDTKVAYFLATPGSDGTMKIVDLVDAPANSIDFNTDVEHHVEIYDESNTVLASYDVVGQNLVPVG